MRKRKITLPLLLFLATPAIARSKYHNSKGNWHAVENLSISTPISVKARHSVHLMCYFAGATEQELFCQPLRPAVPAVAPWPYPSPFPYPSPPRPPEYTFKRENVQEVRLEHSEAANELIGGGIGGGIGAGIGAARYTGTRGPAAFLFGLAGFTIGSIVGRTSPLFHRKVIYER